jgi:hypothetical protein
MSGMGRERLWKICIIRRPNQDDDLAPTLTKTLTWSSSGVIALRQTFSCARAGFWSRYTLQSGIPLSIKTATQTTSDFSCGIVCFLFGFKSVVPPNHIGVLERVHLTCYGIERTHRNPVRGSWVSCDELRAVQWLCSCTHAALPLGSYHELPRRERFHGGWVPTGFRVGQSQ